jgi:hypothetical protein
VVNCIINPIRNSATLAAQSQKFRNIIRNEVQHPQGSWACALNPA